MWRSVTTRFAGLCVLIAGLWGGLIPFVGPYFHFTLGPDKTWTYTSGRLWLDILPAAVAVVGGLLLLSAGPWVAGRLGALLALAGGAWFAVGPDVSMLWHHGVSEAGVAHGHHAITRMLEFLTLHSGIGVLIAALGAYALPGILLWRRQVLERDAARTGTGAAAVPGRRGLFGRRRAVAESVGAGTAGIAAAHRATTTAADRAPAAEPVARERSAAGTGNGAGTGATPANGGATAEPVAGQTQTMTRRRGGLFSRR